MGKKKNIWIFSIILVLQCFVIIAWGTQKERLNVDEVFTMEGAKQGGIEMLYWDLAQDFYGSEHTNKEFLEHMTVYSDELLLRQGLAELGKALCFRNFYYTIINLVASICPGQIPWVAGVGLNILFFIVTQIILYRIAKEFLSDVLTLWPVIIYGFSTGAISTVLYVRCYMLLTMCTLLLFYVYLRFINTEGKLQKVICILCSEILAVLCYRIHPFGVILFAIITFLFLIYMMINKKGECLIWMAAGYGIPVILGWKVIFDKIIAFLSTGVAPLFYRTVKNIKVFQIQDYTMQILQTVAKHFFGNIWIMLLGIAAIIMVFGGIKIKKNNIAAEKEYILTKDKYLLIIPFLILVIYYLILLLGSAVAWKYLSPGYPFIVLSVVVIFAYVFQKRPVFTKGRVAIYFIGICLLISSYDKEHVSELFPGEKEIQNMLEDKYHGINGIMVHHDLAGDGQNWLYEAASIWPQESNVLVIQNKVLREKELCYNREDEKILLWITVDYNKEEAIEWFRECTDYTDIELVLSTEHLYVYECNK